MATATPSRAPAPGQWFDIPGVGGGTQWTDQDESTVDLAVQLTQGTQVQVNGIQPFKQTDVVTDWQLTLSIDQTIALAGGTITPSPYAPYNFIGPVRLLIQNQYASVDVESGTDLWIFNLIRPWRKTFNANQYAAPVGDNVGGTADGYPQAANAQANLATDTWADVTSTWNTTLRLPASCTFDTYWDLDVFGAPVAGAMPHAAIVSPQFMAGATRQVTPQITMAGGFGTLDTSPIAVLTGAPTFAGSASLSFRRKAVYASRPEVLPPAYAWQYRWRTQRFLLGGTSTARLVVPNDTGQLLSLYMRLWDPAANDGNGAPIELDTLTRVQLQYGSGLFSFDGTPAQLQADYLEKHSALLPPGVFCFDLMLDELGWKSNKRAINLLTTAGVLVVADFAAPTSPVAYAVMGLESLVYVA